ncbi:YxiF family protein [Bacillus atrophaeus]|uniref:YxiF family protein n=1 Tax=Bacillus atrophaeus TaxID=1452 RepID=UPI003D1BA550
MEISSNKEAKQLLKETIAAVCLEKENDIVYLFHRQSDEVGTIKSARKECVEHLDYLFNTEYGCELFKKIQCFQIEDKGQRLYFVPYSILQK